MFFFLSYTSYSDITVVQTDSWSDMFDQIKSEESPEKTLLVFDIDKTLLKFTQKCKIKVWVFQLFQCETEPSERLLPLYVKKLQQHGYPTLIITARSSLTHKVTSEQLTLGGFTFPQSPFAIAPFRVDLDEKMKYYGKADNQNHLKANILFNNGVAYAGGFRKDKVLRVLLKRFRLNFERIFFVDDNNKNIRALINGYYSDLETNLTAFYYTRHVSENKKNKGQLRINKLLANYAIQP